MFEGTQSFRGDIRDPKDVPWSYFVVSLTRRVVALGIPRFQNAFCRFRFYSRGVLDEYKVGRIGNVILERSHALAALFSLSRVMRIRRHQRQIAEAVTRLMQSPDSFMYFRGLQPPTRYATSSAFRDQFRSLLTAFWDQALTLQIKACGSLSLPHSSSFSKVI